MKITIYARMIGGIASHVNSYIDILKKDHSIDVISQKDLSVVELAKGYFYVDKSNGIDILKEKIKDTDVLHVHEVATSTEFMLPVIHQDYNMVNTFHVAVGRGVYGEIGRGMTKFFAKMHADRSKKYIAVGRTIKRILEKYNETELINNCLDPQLFRAQKTERYFDDFTVGYLGRLDPEKNVFSVIRACEKLKVKLVVCGSGVKYHSIKKLENNSLKVLKWSKYPPLEFYNGIDLFVSPTYVEANISRTVLEAMACEKPVIVGGCGGEEKNIKPEWGIVSKQDVKSIKRNIKEMMNQDYLKMGKHARKEIIKNYNITTSAKKLEKIYKQVVKN